MNVSIEEKENTEIQNMDEKELLKAVQTADKHIDNIYRQYNKAENAFLQIACELHYLQDDNRYRYASALSNDNDISFVEFSEKMFGFKKSQTYALIGIVDRFGIVNKNGTYAIADIYKEYGQTQLVNMVGLSDTQIAENIKPDMTVAEIKGVVKQITKVKSLAEKEVDISVNDNEDMAGNENKPTVTTVSNGAEVVTTSSVSNTQAIMRFKTYDDFVTNLEEIKKEVKKILSVSDYEVTLNYTW